MNSLTKILTPSEKQASLQKSNTSSPKTKKKGLKKDRSKLQVRKDRVNSNYWKKKAMKKWGEVMHHFKRVCLVNDGCSGNLEAHHLLSRAKVMTRNDIDNGVILCSLHHKWSTDCSPHSAPVQFTEFLRKNYPDKIDYVMEHRNDTGTPNYKNDYENLCEMLE